MKNEKQTWRCMCDVCTNLDKSRKQEKNGCYLYGCNAIPGHYISAWLKQDSDLSKTGCTNFREREEQLKLF